MLTEACLSDSAKEKCKLIWVNHLDDVSLIERVKSLNERQKSREQDCQKCGIRTNDIDNSNDSSSKVSKMPSERVK